MSRPDQPQPATPSVIPGAGIAPGCDSVVVALAGVDERHRRSRWIAVQTRDGLAVGHRPGDDADLEAWQREYMDRMTALHGEETFFLVCTPEEET